MEKRRPSYHALQGLKDACDVWVDEMRAIFKDEGVILFFFLVPLLYPLLYSWIYNNEVVREVPVAIVDLSRSHESREFIRLFDSSPDTRAAYHCQHLSEAQHLVGKHQVNGVLYFPPDFAMRLNRGEQTKVGVYCDMSLMLTYKAIYQTVQAVALDLNARIQVAQAGAVTERDGEIATHPIECDEIPLFNATGGYGNAILPGVLVLILQQTLFLGIGLLAGTAHERRGYAPLLAIARRRGGILRIVAGKSACYFMIYAAIAAYITLCVPRFFHFTSLSTAGPLLYLLIPYLLACVFLGLTLSYIVRHREDIILMVVFTSVPLLFLSGISWPLSNFPAFWQYFAMLFPSTYGIRGFLQVNSMGATIADLQPVCTALWIQVAVYLATALLVFRLEMKRTAKTEER